MAFMIACCFQPGCAAQTHKMPFVSVHFIRPYDGAEQKERQSKRVQIYSGRLSVKMKESMKEGDIV